VGRWVKKGKGKGALRGWGGICLWRGRGKSVRGRRDQWGGKVLGARRYEWFTSFEVEWRGFVDFTGRFGSGGVSLVGLRWVREGWILVGVSLF